MTARAAQCKCGVHGFAMNPCDSTHPATAPYCREARVTLERRQTACRMRHCCARRIVETGGRRKLGCTTTRLAERQRIIEAEANRIAMLTRQRRAQVSDSASAAALRAARLQCEFSLGGCKGGVSLFEKEISLPYPRLPHQVGKNRNLLFQKEPCDIFYCNRSLSNGKHLKHMPHPLADLQAAGNVCALHRLIELF